MTQLAPPSTVSDTFRDRHLSTRVTVAGTPGERQFDLASPVGTRRVVEDPARPFADTGSAVFDGLFALAIEEVRQNSVSAIRAHAFNEGQPIPIEAFETGEMWQYVWTRDVAYAIDLALASLDVKRCENSLLYKTSGWKASVSSDESQQILQDTGSGGSYPVSTDRVIWALAALRILHHTDPAGQAAWVDRTLPILTATIEHDRRLIFNDKLGLYIGEQSFLDWREQTYPNRTATDCLPITLSPSLSTNVAHYLILHTAAAWSRRTGDLASAGRYDAWAADLKRAINDRLYDAEAGMYAGYLLIDLTAPVRVHRYDLLGNCLAILTGLADADQAHRILNSYPTGPFGPPVVWPQESTVPIYHNYAIWPFVTAYWVKAARAAGHDAAVASGVCSLVRASAWHLSNMENLDFGSGDTHGEAHGHRGPKINSRRQLWSVAGYVAMVQDVVFGMQTTETGVRFLPCLPPETRDAYFADRTEIRLHRITYRGKRIDVAVRWPEDAAGQTLAVGRVTLNGRTVPTDFVPHADLADDNEWRIELVPTTPPRQDDLKAVRDFANPRVVFGPPDPAWRPIGQDGVTVRDGRITLHYEPVGDRHVVYNVYRDGVCVARHIDATTWTDPDSADHARVVRQYAVEAVYPDTGNHSYPTAPRWFAPHPPAPEPPVAPSPTLVATEPATFTVHAARAGRHLLRLRYANGNGAINTGLTCGVKRVTALAGQTVVGRDHVFCPQTGRDDVFLWSSTVECVARDAGPLTVTIDEDDVSRNMSSFAHNTVYTGHQGGGPLPCNEIRVRSIELIWLGEE